jgi:hypothetical protein
LVAVARVVPPLSLLPLTDPEYRDFAERQVAESARQRVEAGEWTLMDAHKRARVEQALAAIKATGARIQCTADQILSALDRAGEAPAEQGGADDT